MTADRSPFDVRPLLKSGAVLFAGMTVANVGNYLLSLIVGRLVIPADFGVFSSLINLVAILAMPAAALAMIAVKFSAAAIAHDEPATLRGLHRWLEGLGWWFGATLLILLLLASRPLAEFLNVPSLIPIAVVAAGFSLNFVLLVARGLLQGLQRFTALATNIALEPLLKIAGTVGLIELGLGVNGALASFGVAFLICFLIGRWTLRRELTGPADPVNHAALWRYARPTLATLTALSFLTSLDVILVKHYFSAQTAGLYAGLATIGKIVLFISTPLVAVMFPLIAGKVSRAERHWPLLVQTIALVAGSSLAVVLGFTAAPATVVRLLFGPAYVSTATLLPPLALAMLFLALATVFVHYFLSIGQTRVSWLVTFALIAEILAVAAFHSTLDAVIVNLTAVFGALVLALTGVYLASKRQQLATLVGRVR